MRLLERILGTAAARHLSDLSHGIDPRPVSPRREEKSIGAESTFFDTITDRDHARRVLLDQCHQCAARLRAGSLRARVVVLKARGADFTGCVAGFLLLGKKAESPDKAAKKKNINPLTGIELKKEETLPDRPIMDTFFQRKLLQMAAYRFRT